MKDIKKEIYRLFVNFGRNEPPEGTLNMWAKELDDLGYNVDGIRMGIDLMLRDPSVDLRIANLTQAIADTYIKRKHEEAERKKQTPSLKDYQHRGKGENLAPEIQRILGIRDSRERNMAFLDLSYKMVDKADGRAKVEWGKTIRYFELRLSTVPHSGLV